MQNLCDVCLARVDENLPATFSSLFDKFQVLLDEYGAKFEPPAISTVCPCCLGLMQPFFVKNLLESIQKKFVEEKYDDVTTFNLCISYPLAIFVRDRILQVTVDKIDGNSVLTEEYKNFRDLCKFCYKSVIGKQLNFQCDSTSDFNVCLNFEHPLDDVDVSKIDALFRDGDENSKKKRFRAALEPSVKSKSNLVEKLAELNSEDVEKFFGTSYLSQLVEKTCHVDISFERQPLFIGGRYCKYSRYVHQTPWLIDGQLRSKASVQELICKHLAPDFCRRPNDADFGVKFTASGREDADVRMLGDGRPFALQLANPRRRFLDQSYIDRLAFAVNKFSTDIEVLQFRIVTKRDFDGLNKSDESKVKHYAALCYFCNEESGGLEKNPLPQTSFPLEITQKTPVRVLHRRPLIDRKRKIYSMTMIPVDRVHFQLLLATEAGTYVKEFVHGDFGRTTPSLCDLLGVDVDILELDVEKVEVDWPPVCESVVDCETTVEPVS